MKNFKLILEPCPESWDKMKPKSPKEIKEYVIVNKGNRIGSHFRKSQLDSIIQIPQETFRYNLSFQKLFLLALLLSIFSCKTDSKTQKIDKIEINEYRFDRAGYDRAGYDKSGFDKIGYDKSGYDEYGYDEYGYDEYGFDKEGYDKGGFVEVEDEEEPYFSPDVTPKYEEIKTKIIHLLNTNFKDEIKNKEIIIFISVDYWEIDGILEVNMKGKQQEIVAQLKLKILPLIVTAVKKETEYDYFEYKYNLKF